MVAMNDNSLADPAKLREEAEAWRLTSDDEGDCFEELARILEAAAARIESTEARIAELTTEKEELRLKWSELSFVAANLADQLTAAEASGDAWREALKERTADRDALAKRLEEHQCLPRTRFGVWDLVKLNWWSGPFATLEEARRSYTGALGHGAHTELREWKDPSQ
jgi:hypothetical protein